MVAQAGGNGETPGADGLATRKRCRPSRTRRRRRRTVGRARREHGGVPITIAVGTEPNELVGAASAALGELTGAALRVVEGTHREVYLTDPAVLAAVVGPAYRSAGVR
jgi:hypothetical protein